MKVTYPTGGVVTEQDLLADDPPPRLLCRVEWGPVTAAQVAFYCAAVGVSDPIHYNIDLARASGFGELVVNGSFRWALMTLSAEECLGALGWVAESTCRHLAPMRVGAAVVVELEQAEPVHDKRCVLVARNIVEGSIVDKCDILLRLR
ncbi:MaoC family dehydratase [Actinophytocola sp.]|uniref:MaoC family dehydratase n=1 Tax=Actinophytocola sp. TaxID=1872138 RepID=UPI003D6A9951